MRIVVIGPHFSDSFARNICVTLANMGHAVTSVPGIRSAHHKNRFTSGVAEVLQKAFPQIESARFAEIVEAARRAAPNLVLVTFGGLPPEIVEDLKQATGAPVVCWYTDACTNVHRLYILASRYVAVFAKEPFMVRNLRNMMELNAHYLPEACNPIWHRAVSLTDEQRQHYGCDIAGAGTLHYYRARMFEPFVGRDLKIWGRSCPPWLRSPSRKHYMNEFVGEGTKSVAYRAAKVFVNIVLFQEYEGMNCTLFEAAGCGAFQIAEWKPALPDLFVPEEEIVTYRSRQELIEKVDYYLGCDDERERIAQRACQRAHSDHTYERRLKRMFEVLGLTGSS